MSKKRETEDVGLFGEDPFGEEEATESATEAAAGDDPHLDSEALAEIRDAREEVRRREAEYLDRKERAKEAKEAWEAAVTELTETIDRVTKPLPLFDRKAQPEPQSEDALDWPPEAEATMGVRLAKQIEIEQNGETICYGNVGEVVQAWVDSDGDVFLARRPWDALCYAYLDAEEYEEIEGEGQSRQEAEKALAASQGDAGAGSDGWRTEPIEVLGLTARRRERLTDAGLDTLGKLSDWMCEKGEFWAADIVGIGETSATDIADRFAGYWEKHPECCH